ncbi:MAG: hypothetical protein ACKV2V_00300 [Blastocatellia bacterium]
MDVFWQDVRYSGRSLRKRPGFSAVVILTLALGIGANAAIFSLIYGILLRPFPYRDAERIVRVESVDTKTTGNIQGGSQLDLRDWQQQARNFDAFALYITGRKFSPAMAGVFQPAHRAKDGTQTG